MDRKVFPFHGNYLLLEIKDFEYLYPTFNIQHCAFLVETPYKCCSMNQKISYVNRKYIQLFEAQMLVCLQKLGTTYGKYGLFLEKYGCQKISSCPIPNIKSCLIFSTESLNLLYFESSEVIENCAKSIIRSPDNIQYMILILIFYLFLYSCTNLFIFQLLFLPTAFSPGILEVYPSRKKKISMDLGTNSKQCVS